MYKGNMKEVIIISRILFYTLGIKSETFCLKPSLFDQAHVTTT